MSIKSLLLGSAAAMMVVSGANAADAVFAAEPEPMDYVKICDTYGNGFYYIPGTETCLNFNGYVRVEYIYTDTGGAETGSWQYRGRLNVDARNETDWGTLRSQLRFQGTTSSAGGDANVAIDRALISLGGMRLGYSDTYHTTHHGYGWQKAANDGYYGYDQAIFLDYTFAANGFSATIGIQDTNGFQPSIGDAIDFYAGAAYSASWGRIAASILYDNGLDEINYKASININAIENLGIHAWFMGQDSATATAYQATEWQWGVDVNYQVNAQLNVWVGYTDQDTVADTARFGIGAIWNPVSGLSIRPEAIFGDDYTQVRLRVVRSF